MADLRQVENSGTENRFALGVANHLRGLGPEIERDTGGILALDDEPVE